MNPLLCQANLHNTRPPPTSTYSRNTTPLFPPICLHPSPHPQPNLQRTCPGLPPLSQLVPLTPSPPSPVPPATCPGPARACRGSCPPPCRTAPYSRARWGPPLRSCTPCGRRPCAARRTCGCQVGFGCPYASQLQEPSLYTSPPTYLNPTCPRLPSPLPQPPAPLPRSLVWAWCPPGSTTRCTAARRTAAAEWWRRCWPCWGAS